MQHLQRSPRVAGGTKLTCEASFLLSRTSQIELVRPPQIELSSHFFPCRSSVVGFRLSSFPDPLARQELVFIAGIRYINVDSLPVRSMRQSMADSGGFVMVVMWWRESPWLVRSLSESDSTSCCRFDGIPKSHSVQHHQVISKEETRSWAYWFFLGYP